MNNIVQVHNLKKVYKQGDIDIHAVKDISLSASSGEKIAITGPSGCGKTTLLNMIGLTVKPSSGKIIIKSEETSDMSEKKIASYRNKVFGYIVQDFALIEDYSVYGNVEIPLIYSDKPITRQIARKKIEEALAEVSLLDKINSKVRNLSGGERQRVAIARAIVNDPELILADEPTGSLDSENSKIIIKLLDSLVLKGKSLILVTHDERLAKDCSRQIKIFDGCIV